MPADAFVVVWAFCVAGVTFQFSKELPILGYGVRALQNLYVPKEMDRHKQQSSMVDAIKARCGRVGMVEMAGWQTSCVVAMVGCHLPINCDVPASGTNTPPTVT